MRPHREVGHGASVPPALPELATAPASAGWRLGNLDALRFRALELGRGSTALLAAALALAAVVLIALLPYAFLQDSWLGLVAGREVWTSGLPHHETLTLIPAGTSWVDQQWLSQLLMYGLWRVGGLGLVGIVRVGLLMSGIAGAAAAARRLGASPQSVMRVLPVVLWTVIFGAQVRTQAYAYPLFAAVLYLLAADSRSPSPRVFWCLPLLVLWANLHGSVTLGAGLVALRGLTIVWERRRALLRDAKSWIRPAVLIAAPVACMFATPYGTSIFSYYRETLLDGRFRSSITEWQPLTSVTIIAVPVLLLAGVALWSFGRRRNGTTLWERCALIVLAAGAITAVRNVDWFAIAALMIVSLSIDAGVRARDRGRRVRPVVNVGIAAVAVLALLVSVIDSLGKPASSFERAYQRGALAAVTTATRADRSLRVFAEDKFGDWVLWHDPWLRGRVAYDSRFELLGGSRLQEIAHAENVVGVDWKRIVSGYRLVVIDTDSNGDSAHAFETEPGSRTLYDHGGTAVVLRSDAQARAPASS